jgi:hypothetical protein
MGLFLFMKNNSSKLFDETTKIFSWKKFVELVNLLNS